MTPRKHWAVSVWIDGDNILTIESNCLAGRDLSAEDEQCIRDCARQLLSFVGEPTSPHAPDCERVTHPNSAHPCDCGADA